VIDPILSDLAARCARPELQTLPKYARLVSALQDAIADGSALPGDRLPTETAITQAVPYALGTVQKALNELVDQGVLSRHRKTGTFVRDTAAQLDDISRFNFERPDGAAVKTVKTRIDGIELAEAPGRWTDELGDCEQGYIRISRHDRIDDAFTCYVETHLRADLFGDLLDAAPDSLAGRNIRTILRHDYRIGIVRTEVAVGSTRTADRALGNLGLSAGNLLLELETVGMNRSDEAQFLQTNYFPETDYRVRVY
jgi:GntR family transcriptional regulator